MHGLGCIARILPQIILLPIAWNVCGLSESFQFCMSHGNISGSLTFVMLTETQTPDLLSRQIVGYTVYTILA